MSYEVNQVVIAKAVVPDVGLHGITVILSVRGAVDI